MSLVEWQAMAAGYLQSLGEPRAKPLGRSELAALMQRFPDSE